MVANVNPIFGLTANTPVGQTLTAANTAMDGTGTVATLFTAGASGSIIQGVIVKALGTNVATVARFFLNNGSTNVTATNNILIGEMTLPSTTASNASANPEYYFPFKDNFRIPNGYKINTALGTAVAAGYAFLCYGSDF